MENLTTTSGVIIHKPIELFYTIISKCSNCTLNASCIHFRKEFNEASKKVASLLDKERLIIMRNGAWNEVDKAIELDKLKVRNKNSLSILLSQSYKLCAFEKSAVRRIYDGLNAKYNLDSNYQLIPLVEQLVKLTLYDIRLMVMHNKFGIFTEGEKGLRIVAGMHYSLEISDKIGEIMDKMDKICGQSPRTININVLNASELFGDILPPKKVDIKNVCGEVE